MTRGFCRPFFFDRNRFLDHDLGFSQSDGGRFGLRRFGQHFLGVRFFFSGRALGFRRDDNRFGLQVGCLLFSISRLDLLDQCLLGDFFGSRYGNLFLTIGSGKLAGVFDFLFFFDHRSFDDDALADHVLDNFLFDFDRFFFVDFRQA